MNKQYLNQINLDLREIFRRTSCGYSKMIQTNKQTNKQTKTNKQTFCALKYINIIKSDFY